MGTFSIRATLYHFLDLWLVKYTCGVQSTQSTDPLFLCMQDEETGRDIPRGSPGSIAEFRMMIPIIHPNLHTSIISVAK